MNTPSGRILVLAGQDFVCIKIIGRANFTSSIDFRTLIMEMQKRGFAFFILDLAECVLMDSTFLGVLSGFGLKMGVPDSTENKTPKGIELLNPNTRILELLENLGVLHLFRVCQGEKKELEGVAPQPVAPLNPSKEEVTKNCLEAHKTLMNINPDNVARFKEVTQFLAEDLKRSRQNP